MRNENDKNKKKRISQTIEIKTDIRNAETETQKEKESDKLPRTKRRNTAIKRTKRRAHTACNYLRTTKT